MTDCTDLEERSDLALQARMAAADALEIVEVDARTGGDRKSHFADASCDSQALPDTLFVAARLGGVCVDPAATRLTDAIVGCDERDLADTLRRTAAEIGCSHISYVRLSPDKSADTGLLTAVVTYSRLWQVRYFIKQYVRYDPIIAHGRHAVLPFDWATLPTDDPMAKAFLIDALRHDVGRNGLSIPLRSRRGVVALVSFTSDLSTAEWEVYKANNMARLRLLSVLIDSAANINFKMPPFPVNLSSREEQCLIWAARGKTYHEVGEILNIAFGSVKTHLDAARHKLRCVNLTHAVAVALATGVIPGKALK
jgi:DNA-binding CsgD family transcriptional regulator